MRYLKTFENLNQAKSIIAKKMEAFDKLKVLLAKNLGYIGKFTEYLMNENIPYDGLVELYNQLLDLKSKGQGLDISELKYEKALDRIQEIKNESSVRNLTNQFPSEQKNIARQLSSRKDGFNLLLKVSKQADIAAFITKISRYKTSDDLRSALTIFSKERFNQREEVKKYVESSKSRIALEKDNLVIVEIKSFDDIKKLGSDTSWCILGQSMYSSYTTNRLQFILFDYSKEEFETKFKIGFTLNRNLTIHACHDMLDYSCRDHLNSLLDQNDIKFTELIKEEDKVVIKPIIPSEINSRTSIMRLEEIRDNCTKEQIPDIVKKIVAIGIFDNYKKSKILAGVLKRYFVDKQYITVNDFAPFELVPADLKRILDFTEIKSIFVDEDRLNFNSLSNQILIQVIPIWSEDALKQITMTNLYTSDGIFRSKYIGGKSLPVLNPPKIESAKLLSERLNQIYKKDPDQSVDFIEVMCVLNASLGKPVNKKFESQIKGSTKLRFLEFLKLPIDPDDLQLNQITKELLQYVIKKQPTKEIYLYKSNFETAEELSKHLKDFKLTFKLSTDSLRDIRRSLSSIAGKNEFYDALNKMPQRPRQGRSVEEGNLKFYIY